MELVYADLDGNAESLGDPPVLFAVVADYSLRDPMGNEKTPGNEPRVRRSYETLKSICNGLLYTIQPRSIRAGSIPFLYAPPSSK